MTILPEVAQFLLLAGNLPVLHGFVSVRLPSTMAKGANTILQRARPPQFNLEEIEALEHHLEQLDLPPSIQDANNHDLEDHSDECEFQQVLENVITFTIEEEHHNKRIDVAVAAAEPKLSRSLAGALVEDGRVHLLLENGKLELLNRKAFKVEKGMTLQIKLPTEETPTEILPQKLPLDVIYEDEHMIVLNKAADMVVHPAAGNWDGTVVNALAYYLANDSPFGTGDFVAGDGKVKPDVADGIDVDGTDGEAVSFRPGIVHRLDKGTTGILVVAKTRASLAALSESFKSRKVKKTYLAVTVGNPGKRVTIDKPIGRHPIHRQRMRVVPDPHKRNSGGFAPKDRLVDGRPSSQAGRRALSYVDSIAFDGKLSMVQVRIETGRTHQIRVHLQDRHTPIYGDDVYGLADWNQRLSKVHQITRPLLHAYTLEVNHPITGDLMKFRAPVAEDMERIGRAIWPQADEERPDIFAR
jgi:23S rRNA pseudouridine1911/1915/1917 synthase